MVVRDFIIDSSALGFVMDLVQGPSLEQVINTEQSGRWPVQETLRVMMPVLEALAYAQARGIVHRDLKPANVLLDRSGGGMGRPQITDFGLAKILATEGRGMTRTGTMMGTLPYMAPEQFRGDMDVDARADVYAAGMMMWRLLTGELPVNAEDISMCAALYDGRLALPPLATQAPVVPAGLSTVVKRALSLPRERRQPDAGALAAELSRHKVVPPGPEPATSHEIAPAPYEARQAGRKPRVPPATSAIRRLPWMLLGTGILLIGTGATVAAFWMKAHQSREVGSNIEAKLTEDVREPLPLEQPPKVDKGIAADEAPQATLVAEHNRLLAHEGGRTRVVINIREEFPAELFKEGNAWFDVGAFEVVESTDLDGDGSVDHVVSFGHSGNACGGDNVVVVTLRPGNSATISNAVGQPCQYRAIRVVGEPPSVRIETEGQSVIQTWRYSAGQLIETDSREKGELLTLVELREDEVGKGKSILFDLDSDGVEDEIRCRYWGPGVLVQRERDSGLKS